MGRRIGRKNRRPQEAKAPRLLPLQFLSEIRVEHTNNYLVKGWQGAGTLVCTYGKPKGGKTAIELDQALHIAAGMEWRGRKVLQGLVIYLALEGGGGVRKRVKAWCKQKGIEDTSDLPFAIIATGVNFRDSRADRDSLIATIKDAAEKRGMAPVLIVVDTLSRALASGDEDTENMGALVMNCDAIRHATGAAVEIVHHSGKDASKGARGSSVLLGAIDTQFEITKDDDADICTMQCTAQRDLEMPEDLNFHLEGVQIGIDGDGDPVTAVVALPTDQKARKGSKLNDKQRRALEALREAIEAIIDRGETVTSRKVPFGRRCTLIDDWRGQCVRRGILDDPTNEDAKGKAAIRTAWWRLRGEMLALNCVGIWEKYVWECQP